MFAVFLYYSCIAQLIILEIVPTLAFQNYSVCGNFCSSLIWCFFWVCGLKNFPGNFKLSLLYCFYYYQWYILCLIVIFYMLFYFPFLSGSLNICLCMYFLSTHKLCFNQCFSYFVPEISEFSVLLCIFLNF